jgi:hypothetical protein
MATKADAVAAKARQQKIILVVGGLLLAILLVIQGPKLKNQLSGSKKSSSSAPATTTPDTTGTSTPSTTPSTGTTVPSTGATTPTVVTGRGPTAKVAGVLLRPAGAPAAGTGQLWSLSRFKAKDPFVPGVNPGTDSGTGSTSASSGSGTGTTASSPTSASGSGSSTGSVASPSTSTPVALGYATLMVNGKPMQLQVKDLFPKRQPTFVLTAVAKHSIKIKVAGGRFTEGAAVVLDLGKRVTLMNTTTGQRFVMKLVFTGTQPEQIAGFKQPAAGTTASPSATTPAPSASTP